MSSSSRIATDLPEPDIPETTTRRIKLGGKDQGGPSPPAPLPKGRGERQLASGFTGAPHPRPLSPREEGSVSLHRASRGPLTPGPSPQGKREATGGRPSQRTPSFPSDAPTEGSRCRGQCLSSWLDPSGTAT